MSTSKFTTARLLPETRFQVPYIQTQMDHAETNFRRRVKRTGQKLWDMKHDPTGRRAAGALNFISSVVPHHKRRQHWNRLDRDAQAASLFGWHVRNAERVFYH